MAFGKKSENLSAVGSFRQAGAQWNQTRQNRKEQRSGGGGAVPSWINEYKPPTGDLDLIRLIAGSYIIKEPDALGNLVDIGPLPFYPYTEHYDARSKKRANCSAGPFSNSKDKRQPCHGCDLFWSSMKTNEKGRKERGFMGKRDMVAFTILHYHDYHKVPQVDRDGSPKINPNTQQPYHTWLRCQKDSKGRGKCEHCAAGFEVKFGMRLHWPMGTDHFNTLMNKETEIGRSCVGCGGHDTIVTEALICPNEGCGEAILDDPSSLKENEVAEIASRPSVCPGCKQKVIPQEVVQCTGCSTPKRASLFDVDLKISRVEATDGTQRTSLNISSFILQPIDVRLKEIALPEKLDRVYAPTPLDIQATIFGVTGAPVRTPVTASRPYGK